ncbi:UDP-N-acetylmuramoylalanyl-D-glutamate--2,6-diaminopimelate ligase [Thermoflexibacter ruber]|uniref:UDP-N-acetylmuramoyl-L-alanyl-D-glutamate--2,6-diaminopimelate ligase n=1 Tax=Thermoflexibacter ruber TaxID=1003 RepID=A0A1I2HV73_9BACT|nr:UDP-N-acetylmuramoylalanyl-D-glutamate--2,6-diaminopimelate ligase [Thermoflexibacter ruber]
MQGATDLVINQVRFDSRKVQQGDVFVAVKGLQSDGHQFISKAIESGAVAIVLEEQNALKTLPEGEGFGGAVIIKVQNSAAALGMMASNFYDNPSEKLKLVGITGTNGKTTTVTLLYRLFRELGYKVGLISTIENRIDEEVIPTNYTTPDALELNKLLALMAERKCTHVFMEVSSHALAQHRVAGIKYSGAMFSNITHDHLDFHKTFAEYLKAKKMFFDNLEENAFALVNKDDKNGLVMLQNCKGKHHTFALNSMADFKAKIIANTFEGLELEIDNQRVWFKLSGSFNAYNLLGIYAAAVLLGEEKSKVLEILSNIEPAAGRFDKVIGKNKVFAIIDYAHTPDALKNVLENIQKTRTGKEKVITVVGCGGNRDATKRPIMAKIACELSDKVILTSDNPRFEEPEAILEDMKKGVPQDAEDKTLVMTDRKEALAEAVKMAQPNDIILVAGKGHENYQEIKGIKYPFDDKKIMSELLES